ncbi:hypothetical protein HGRIS_002477 [Hohenbuehelia grisea]|uniref:DNA polymerase kappa n=1 Tax=Hohenbuehelia grisea TaxID=104357 RepID=A0ABR3JLI4_9AGAR
MALPSSQLTDSLVKRLAGPSTGKAGLAKDQTEINRIIAEASKGSKFYENEKRKDQDLTQRISRILRIRDEVMKGADLGKIEKHADQLLVELEAERDLSQVIIHCDMDAFFANVELLHDPSLKGKPFAVGGGVISTASYEARAFGVRSGMSGFIAKKLCPGLILLKSHYDWYSEISNQVFDVLKRYDPTLCVAGCDEGYLNITPYLQQHNLTPDVCVQQIRQSVYEATNLTVSAGIAPNKMLAKICSDKNKPDGQYHLPFDSDAILDFMRDLPIRKIPGIGRVNERLLDSVGIKTCGDVYTHRATISLLDKQLGLRFLLRTYLGISSNVVRPYQREERKSIGAERTFSSIGDESLILQKLEDIAEELEKDMQENQWAGRTVTLKFKLDTYQVFTRAKSFPRWVTKKDDLFAAGKELIRPEFPLKIRLIGLRVTKLKDLKAAAASTGIKRFFEPVQLNSSSKKRRLDEPCGNEIIDISSVDDEQALDDEVMPGFHEFEEEETPLSQQDVEDDEPEALFNPPSEPVSRAKPASSTGIKPASKKRPRESSTPSSSILRHPSPIPSDPSNPEDSLASHTCPVCAKILVTNNQDLNAHIDFCLSKGAIREAQVEASARSPVKPTSSKGPSSKRSKPETYPPQTKLNWPKSKK